MSSITDRPRRPLASLALAAALACALPLAPTLLPAAQAASADYDIPAGPLETALNRFGREAGILLSFPSELVAGRQSPGLRGRHEVGAALELLLRGTGLQAREQPQGGWALVRRGADGAAAEALPAITARAAAETATGPVRGYVARRSATATKTDTALLDTPQSVSVVGAERIEALGATRLGEVLAYTPGVDATIYGNDSRYDWIAVRGFETLTPGYYLDGLQLRNNAWWAVWQTENYGVERIEIQRGPASVLWGQNGPGGMINMVSKRPAADLPQELRLTLGSDARRDLAADLSGAFGEGDAAQWRLVGLLRDAELPAGGMADDRQYLAPSLTLQFGADTRLTLLSQFLRTRAGVYARVFPELGTLVPTPAGTHLPATVFAEDPEFNRFDQDQAMLGYEIEHRLDDRWTLSQSLRWARLDADMRNAYQTGYLDPDPADPLDPASWRVLGRTATTSREKIHSLVVDSRIQGEFVFGDWRHTLLAGLDLQRSRADQVSVFGATVAPLDLYAPVYGVDVVLDDPSVDTRTVLRQTGLYLQDQIRHGAWVLTLGARHDRAGVDTDDHLAGSSTRQRDHHTGARAGVVYRAAGGWAPYASYSSSFAPSTVVDPATGKPFDPETGRQLEAGVRFEPAGHAASYSAAVFELRRRNYVSYDLDYVPSADGEVTVRGLELEAVAEPRAGMNLTASYAFTPKADVTRSANPAEVGKQATAVSRHRLSLWADQRFASGLKLGLGARLVGSHRGIGETAARDVPGYTLYDALLGWDWRAWSLALNVSNLADKDVITNCSSGYCYYGSRRKTSLNAAYRF
ncbi:TonB-dependent siderophore receptor [Rubrivivax gelatinosus]|uniref:Iron complex outermembrane receptor protein n=1 Tax=Rubrivivax gelatinosus TaxID=28068 RepID=A0A4R2MEK0_RUBGE|nr:TonB-dependent siderophore receptor [Rubrivivax gelatinosus]MBK1687571.1 TonB-dependent siderophore receptor [Rubrivivax gelatinosus]TCP02944.1 iron complex outermembrane receptor protein [Rubrivivax gelatinosus]